MAVYNVTHRVAFYEARRQHAAVVFISHRKADVVVAAGIAKLLEAVKIYYYFDETDAMTQQALDLGDHQALADAIRAGMERCSHVLAVISEKTAGSWWVPYEIGMGAISDRPLALVLRDDVSRTEMPSYLKIAPVIERHGELGEWLERRVRSGVRYLVENAAKSTSYPSLRVPHLRR